MAKVKTIEQIEALNAVEPYFGKGIQLAGGFDLGAKAPLDSRSTVKTIEERDAHVTGNRAYEGMLVYVEANKKTYQYVDNKWEEFGFNEEKFQEGIVEIVEKNEEQDSRLEILEGLVIGGEGEGLQGVIEDVAKNTQAIKDLESSLGTEVAEREAAVAELEGKLEDLKDETLVVTGNLQSSIDAINNSQTGILAQAKAYTDGEIAKVEGSISSVADELAAAQGEIQTVKSDLAAEVSRATGEEAKIRSEFAAADAQLSARIDAINNAILDKNSNTQVFDSMDEFHAYAQDSDAVKVGDLAFVLDVKKAFIYRGENAVQAMSLPIPPAGWVYFDEISTEVDLKDYLKSSDAEATYRKLSDDITISDLSNEIVELIGSKANAADVYTKSQTDSAIKTQADVLDGKISAVSGELAAAKTQLEGEISKVDGKVTGLETSLGQTNASLAELTNKVNTNTDAIADAEGRITAVEGEVAKVPGLINTAVNASEGRIGSLINAIEGRLDTVEPKVSNLEGRMTSVEGKANANASAIAALDIELKATDAEVDTLKEKVSALEAKEEVCEEFVGADSFNLSQAPVTGSVSLYVNGIKYRAFSVEGSIVSWTGHDSFSLDATDSVEVFYIPAV